MNLYELEHGVIKPYIECLEEARKNPGFVSPFIDLTDHYQRRIRHAGIFGMMDEYIQKLFYPHFISYPEEAELIEALIRSTQSRKMLEVGCFAGFTTLHMIRAVYPGGMVVAVDKQDVLPDIFKHPEIAKCFRFHQGTTPEVFDQENGTIFDLVYVDSDHSPEHTSKEIEALMKFTAPGSMFLFHDCAPKLNPKDEYGSGPVWKLLYSYVTIGLFSGGIFPSVDRWDCRMQHGENYDRNCLPHIGIFRRVK
jgi:predicted O-methyltransferase YrrM